MTLDPLSWAVIVFLAGQTIAAIWWASKITSDVHYIKENIYEIKKDVETSYPIKDGTRLETRVERLELSVLSDRH